MEETEAKEKERREGKRKGKREWKREEEEEEEKEEDKEEHMNEDERQRQRCQLMLLKSRSKSVAPIALVYHQPYSLSFGICPKAELPSFSSSSSSFNDKLIN
ncbi:uncharacterized protein MONOS_10400 [Monocercomonoides exilis]|uniref:uncharacterized protein n=1 Tax=Monocercomonoides exilis TaxID=2049356 RepID=UPI00355A5E3D|nr:hypothetical protein MONOS_10400 [Monocercomonoides exilis]|eukprot:MONOS_10400.1-p1 / transcript=MONOS_10400.1 / gene=MONOS_10400 / organism=Monocercomonoides_exilis_PA203 / gene_product=unspecified product / transcript_product=unspecified product / location=Mono_scaffold00472:37197-37502(+) / protein_length=102 / sequence_SO=supercontig / SO=protein_coding / is_pseudo=false